MAATVTLYHYTCLEHLDEIVRSGLLRTTESNVSQRRPHAGPDVVWLTTAARPSAGHGLQSPLVDKTRIRVTVEVPRREVVKWGDFAARWGVDVSWLRHLNSAGGAGTWRVLTRPIPRVEWREIRDLSTDEVVPHGEAPAAIAEAPEE